MRRIGNTMENVFWIIGAHAHYTRTNKTLPAFFGGTVFCNVERCNQHAHDDESLTCIENESIVSL